MHYKNILHTILTAGIICCWFLSSFGQVVINEYTCSNKDDYLDNFGEYEDWIEFYNTGGTTADISGYFLTDKNGNRDKWAFPAGTNIPAAGRLRIFASGIDTVLGGQIHSSFKLTQMKQEYIIFSNALDTSVVDSIRIDQPTQRNHSRGRETDGAVAWKFFTNPTPNNSNNFSTAYDAYAVQTVFDVAQGFYPSTVTLSLSSPESNITIRYTTDGTEPTAASSIYTAPLSISNTTIVRARCFSSNSAILPSFTKNNSYFINENHTFPVISVASADFPNLFNGTPEIMSSFEYFDANQQFQFEMEGDFRGHGNDSWAFNQKGIRFYVRDQYGYANKIDYPIFPSSPRTDFDVLIIRNSGSDNYPGGSTILNRPTCHVRDGYIQTLAEDHNLNVDTRKYQPCIVYLNGEYWGIYEIRERIDSDYTEYYHNQKEKRVDMLEYWGALSVRYGTTTDWNALYTYMTTNSLANVANYNYVLGEIDEMSFLDYFIMNTHIVNTDWLNWNTKWWRGTKPTAPTGWRYTFWDMDNVFNLGQNYTGVGTTTYLNDPCNPQTLFPGNPSVPHMDMINALLANPTFYDLYINRYADLLNTTLNCDTMLSHFDAMIAALAVEMPQQITRWGGTMTEWNANVQLLRAEITGRCTVIDSLIIGCYQPNIGTKAPIVVNVSPAGSGNVKINTIYPNAYPWNGDYFTSVNLSFQAFENTGFAFDHWEVFNHTPIPGTLVDSIYFDFTTADSVVAVFRAVLGITGTTTNDNCNNTGTGTIALAINGGLAPYTFNWSNGATDQNISGLQSGNYDVTITDTNNDSSSQSFVIQNNPAPTSTTVALNDDCYGSGVGTINLSVTGGAAGYSFYWSNGNSTEDISNLVAGNYSVTITDAANCTITQNAVVNQDSIPTALSSTQDISCFGNSDGSIDITISGGAPPYTFAWNSGSTTEDANNLAAGSYNLTVSDANNCTTTIASALTEPNQLTLALDVSHTENGSDGEIATTATGGTSPYTYVWDDPASQTTPTAIGLAPNTYQVIVIDAQGCQETANATVELAGMDCIKLTMTFTPNGDGVNDTWVLDCIASFKHVIMVYNRWGQMLYRTENFDGTWDGTVNGEQLPDGAYFYTMEITEQNGEVKYLKGALNIIR